MDYLQWLDELVFNVVGIHLSSCIHGSLSSNLLGLLCGHDLDSLPLIIEEASSGVVKVAIVLLVALIVSIRIRLQVSFGFDASGLQASMYPSKKSCVTFFCGHW